MMSRITSYLGATLLGAAFFFTLFVFSACPVVAGDTGSVATDLPVLVIYDTDMGNDVDDALALAILHAGISRGKCALLAVTITKANPAAVEYVHRINTFYGRPEIPVGWVENGPTPDDGDYLKQTLAEAQEHRLLSPTGPKSLLPAVKVLRQTLAKAEDRSVVIVQVGFSTNLAQLLDSPADDLSPLTGRELASQKVKYLSAMAGAFTDELKNHPEYNVVMDVPSAKKVFAEWPTPILVSGFEIGLVIPMTGSAMAHDYRYVPWHPIQASYRHYRGLENDQCTWDLTCALEAVWPERDYFDLTEPGEVRVRDDGTTFFLPKTDGRCRLFVPVTPERIARVQEAFFNLCSEPPDKK